MATRQEQLPAPDGAQAAVECCPGRGRVSPVFRGGSAFDRQGRPHVVRLEVPIAAEEMVAALHMSRSSNPIEEYELAADEDVWKEVAHVLVEAGLPAVEKRADEILVQDHRGKVWDVELLEMYRRRVAEVTGDDPRRPRRCED